MYGGAIGWNGGAPLKRVAGNLNAHAYQNEIIHDLAEVGHRIASGGRGFIFQQDRAPAHSAASTRNFLQERGIVEIDWPGNSPDLNIIENLWATISRKVQAHPTMPRNAEELWERIQNAWDTLPMKSIRILYRSIPSRIRSVLEVQGGTTRY